MPHLPRLIFGYHGCDEKLVNEIICGNKELVQSRNDYDWLGDGIYFWEDSFTRAKAWAEESVKRGKYKAAGVVGAIIDPGTA